VILLKLMLIPMLLKVLERTNKPLLCGLFYALAILTNGLIFDLAFGRAWTAVALDFVIALGASSVFFVLVSILDGGLYWLALAAGIPALLWL